MKADLKEIREFITTHPVLFAATAGFDKKPRVHPIELCYEENGAFYFAAAKCDTVYGEISLIKDLALCTYDMEQGIALTLRGKPVFTEETAVISHCLNENENLKARWGKEPEMLIAWFLKDAVCEIENVKDGTRQTVELGNPEGLLTGITFKKDKELRDRLVSVMEEREKEAADRKEISLQKLYDGAVLYFAETAKELWPRMDIGPIERSLLYETYDEREEFILLAKKLIGNAEINKPEDLTYWLNKETLQGLFSE